MYAHLLSLSFVNYYHTITFIRRDVFRTERGAERAPARPAAGDARPLGPPPPVPGADLAGAGRAAARPAACRAPRPGGYGWRTDRRRARRRRRALAPGGEQDRDGAREPSPGRAARGSRGPAADGGRARSEHRRRGHGMARPPRPPARAGPVGADRGRADRVPERTASPRGRADGRITSWFSPTAPSNGSSPTGASGSTRMSRRCSSPR